MKPANFRRVLQNAGLLQKDFAKLAGMDITNVSFLANNETNPTEKTIKKICKVTGCKPEDLWKE